MAILTSVGGGGAELETVNEDDPETAPMAAVMVGVPAAIALAKFWLPVVVAGMVAKAVFELDHAAWLEQFKDDPSLKLQVAM